VGIDFHGSIIIDTFRENMATGKKNLIDNGV
jgi:hypothetical protein